MVTRLMLIQKIHINGTLEIFQAHSDIFHWTFESHRTQLSEDKRYFPFVLEPDCANIRKGPVVEAGIVMKEDEIRMSTDYACPGGTVIGILFPPLFVPADLMFVAKAYIPIGPDDPVPAKPPGQLEVVHNELEKRCAIIFHIHKNSCFGFECLSKKVKNQEYVNRVGILKREMLSKKMVPEVWLQSHEVMKMLKISERALMRRRQNGSIPYSGDRSNYLYRRSDIEKLLR